MRRMRSCGAHILRVGFLCVATWSITLCLASRQVVAQAEVDGSRRSNPQPRVDVREAPWDSIGKLQSVAGGIRETCTAALVGSRMVLSAAHCLFNRRTRHYFSPLSVHFVAGLEGQSFTAAAMARQLMTGPGYDPENPGGTMGSDWSLIELASDVGNADHVLPLSRRIPPDGTMLMVGGYAQEHPNVLTADLDCRVTGSFVDSQGRRLIRHNCATSRGVSGAPLLVRTETGWSIVGINVAQAKDGANGFAVALGEVWPHL